MKHKTRVVMFLLLVLVAALGAAFGTESTPARGPDSSVAHALASAVPPWQQVNANGFGDPHNREVTALETFGGYLYAGTHNPLDPELLIDGARIFRSADGLTWTAVTQPGFGNSHDSAPPAILDFAVFNERLYAGTGRGNASQIWRTLNGTIWAPVDVTGFGDPDNVAVTALAPYKGLLYAGVTNKVSGAQIWRSFTGDNNTWTKVAPAAPGQDVAAVSGFAEFDGALYAAVESDAPAQIWRTFGGDWSIVVDDGFGSSKTIATGGLAAFGGYLYVGAGNKDSGAQLWRTSDGDSWQPAITPGFGNAANEAVEAVVVFDNKLYVGVKNAQTGIQLWRSANGTTWERANLDGFGDSSNTTANGSNATAHFLGTLYQGTANAAAGGELWRMQQGFGVSLSGDQAKAGAPAQTVSYIVAITNTGSAADSFDLTITGHAWTTTLSTPAVDLAPAAGTEFMVSVAIPPGAADRQSDTVTVTATSRADPGVTAAARLTTTSVASPVCGVRLTPNDQSRSGSPGEQITFALSLTNTGSVADTFDLTATGNHWATMLSSTVVRLSAGAAHEVRVTVLIPPTAATQENDQVTIRATSRSDATKQAAAVLTAVCLQQSSQLYLPILTVPAPP